jgi:hypothetical protein
VPRRGVLSRQPQPPEAARPAPRLRRLLDAGRRCAETSLSAARGRRVRSTPRLVERRLGAAPRVDSDTWLATAPLAGPRTAASSRLAVAYHCGSNGGQTVVRRAKLVRPGQLARALTATSTLQGEFSHRHTQASVPTAGSSGVLAITCWVLYAINMFLSPAMCQSLVEHTVQIRITGQAR